MKKKERSIETHQMKPFVKFFHKQPNLRIPEFLQDKNSEKKEKFDLSIILDEKIKELSSSGKEKSKKGQKSSKSALNPELSAQLLWLSLD